MDDIERDLILAGKADIPTYKATKHMLQESLCTVADEREASLLRSMISDCDYVIQWLETGRRPGNKRGIERYAAYQREIPTEIVQRYMQPAPKAEIGTYTEEQWGHAEFIVSIMSERERQCFEMHYIGLYSMEDISEELGIEKGTVQTYLKRANEKVKMYKNRTIQLLLDVV